MLCTSLSTMEQTKHDYYFCPIYRFIRSDIYPFERTVASSCQLRSGQDNRQLLDLQGSQTSRQGGKKAFRSVRLLQANRPAGVSGIRFWNSLRHFICGHNDWIDAILVAPSCCSRISRFYRRVKLFGLLQHEERRSTDQNRGSQKDLAMRKTRANKKLQAPRLPRSLID